ncbi:MAG TPA: hypothetical protein DEF48_07825 [Nostoc sp. UBA8866]|nr:hypothetical protein [Nostoc sp. UBA8866]
MLIDTLEEIKINYVKNISTSGSEKILNALHWDWRCQRPAKFPGCDVIIILISKALSILAH